MNSDNKTTGKMTLFRFCSFEEQKKLSAGEIVRNTTDHYRNGYGGSVSRGFCLTHDDPPTAWKYLKGIVTPEVCLCLEIDANLLTPSCGKYATDYVHHPDGCTYRSVIKREWCIDTLRPEWLKEVIPLEQFVPDYELEAARYIKKLMTAAPFQTFHQPKGGGR